MLTTHLTPEEIARIGEGIYRQDLRAKLLPQNKGRFLTVDINSGDYEIDDDDLSGELRLRVRRPDGVFFGLRIGYTTAYTVGAPLEEDAP